MDFNVNSLTAPGSKTNSMQKSKVAIFQLPVGRKCRSNLHNQSQRDIRRTISQICNYSFTDFNVNS